MVMKYLILALVIAGCIFVIGQKSIAAQEVKTASSVRKIQPGEEIFVIVTKYGKVKIQFFPDVAPKHVAHFKKLIKDGFYDGVGFHRAVPNLIVQGGDPNTKTDNRESWGMGDPRLETIEAEFNDRPFVKGSLGAARAADPNSASTQFFICVTSYPAWNGQYTNLGQVISGIETVQRMTLEPSENGSGKLKNKIVMTKVYLEKYRKPIRHRSVSKRRKSK